MGVMQRVDHGSFPRSPPASLRLGVPPTQPRARGAPQVSASRLLSEILCNWQNLKNPEGLAMESMSKGYGQEGRAWPMPFPRAQVPPLLRHREDQIQPSGACVRVRIGGFCQVPTGLGLQLTAI